MKSLSANKLFFLGIFMFVGTLGVLSFYGQDIHPDYKVSQCIDELESRLNRPMSFERTIGTTERDGSLVTFEYTAQNGFGNVIPGRVRCNVFNDGRVSLYSYD